MRVEVACALCGRGAMSISFKNPDGTYTIDAATYRRHTNPSGEPGGVVDLRIEVGNNVTILEGLARLRLRSVVFWCRD